MPTLQVIHGWGGRLIPSQRSPTSLPEESSGARDWEGNPLDSTENLGDALRAEEVTVARKWAIVSKQDSLTRPDLRPRNGVPRGCRALDDLRPAVHSNALRCCHDSIAGQSDQRLMIPLTAASGAAWRGQTLEFDHPSEGDERGTCGPWAESRRDPGSRIWRPSSSRTNNAIVARVLLPNESPAGEWCYVHAVSKTVTQSVTREGDSCARATSRRRGAGLSPV